MSGHKTKVQEIYEKYYSDISYEIYLSIVVSDPTTPFINNEPNKLGQYGQWLLNLYKQDNLKFEDLYKATEYLTLFQELKSKNLIPTDQRDIGKIHTLPELLQLNEKIGGTGKSSKDETYLLNDKFFINNKQAICLLDNERWLVVIPKTYDASQFYACYTSWCTQFPEMYNSYAHDGDLVIFINKGKINTTNTTRRLQLHLRTHSFMNVNDAPVTLSNFIKNEQYLNTFFIDYFKGLLDNNHELDAEIFQSLPEVKLYELRRRVDKGLLLTETELATLNAEDTNNTISSFLSNYRGQMYPEYYYQKSSNKQKTDYINFIIKYNHKIPLETLKFLDQTLLNFYIEYSLKHNKIIDENILVRADTRQKGEYVEIAILKRHGEVSELVYNDLTDEQKKDYLVKRVNSGSPYITDKMFFESSSNIRNYFIGCLCEKMGESNSRNNLTKKQLAWATTDGFL